MKKIIVACGSGIAVSQMIAFKVRKLLAKRQIEVEIETIGIRELEQHLDSSVAYISVIKTEKDYEIPVIDGVAFLTGKGEEEELNKLIQAMEQEV